MNRGSAYKRIPDDPNAKKAAIITAVICLFLIFGSIQALKLLPSYDVYKPFYEGAKVYIGLLFVSVFILAIGVIILMINEKTPKVLGIFGFTVFAILFINPIMLYEFNSNPIDWFSDLKYAVDNNPPSAIDVLKVKRYVDSHSTGKGGVSSEDKADIKVGNMSFTVDDEGTIKQFLDTHKEGDTVKIHYMPKTNILISIEDK